MNLKQSDKLIAIIGVVILVIAGIAIVLYTSTNENNEDVDKTSDTKLYEYSWEKETDSYKIDGLAQKTYEDSQTITSSKGTVLTSVTVTVNWEDDRTHGLLTTKGKDTLTAEIALQGGTSKTDESTGSGNMSFDFTIHDIPPSDNVEAEDLQSAEDIIKNEFYDNENEAIFDIKITVQTGEKLGIRPLKFIRWFLDKGNDFEIEYTYTYYTFDVEEPEDNNDDTTTTGQNQDTDYNGAIGEFYRNIGYGRGFI